MSIRKIIGNRAGRFITALMLAYALMLQVLLPQGMAFAADANGQIICLSTTNTNTPESPLKSHQDCTCPALCAAVAVGIAPEVISEILPPLGAGFVISQLPPPQAQAFHLWSGVNARGPPELA